MIFEEKKQETIRRYQLRKIAVDDPEFIFKTMDNFDIESIMVEQFLQEYIQEGFIAVSKERNCGYKLVENRNQYHIVLNADIDNEDRIYKEYIEPNLKYCNENALLELYKGKITSKAECHSGEEIFFSSKLVDSYALWSDARIYECGHGREPKVIESHLLAYASRIGKVGTMVSMSLENETQRKIADVFDMYTDIEEGLVKTRIPIKEACMNDDPVARSQARRICNRLEEFKEVVLDFSGVEFMGQGFSDELFRIYALNHPDILLRPINMIPIVARMVKHVGRGRLASNVCLDTN